jgi:hypothetical protein
MDMNTEFPGLAIRKYVEPVEDMEPTPKAPELHARGVHSGVRSTSLSPFERLPLELR